MRNSSDPPRLRSASDSPVELVLALELARSDLPEPDAIDEIAAGLGPALSGESGVRTGSRSRHGSIRPVAAGAAMSIKLLLAAAVAAAGLSTAIWRLARAPDEAPPPPRSPSLASSANRQPQAPTREEPVGEEKAVPAEVVGEARGPRAQTGNGVTLRGAEPPAAQPVERPASVGSAEFPEATTAMETALLGRAERALGSDASAALRLAEEHRERFPGGVLIQEREFITIRALLGLGRRSEAVERAATFRNRFPRSAHLRRLDLLLGTMPDDDP